MALNKITAFKSQVRANSTSETPVIKSTKISDNLVVRIANISVAEENVTVRKTTSSNKFFASKLLNYLLRKEVFNTYTNFPRLLNFEVT